LSLNMAAMAFKHECGYIKMLPKGWLLVNLVAQLAWEVEEPEDMRSGFRSFSHRGGLSDDGLARPALGHVRMRMGLVCESRSHGEIVESGLRVVLGLRTGSRCRSSAGP
jgi:hypothetical protein